MGVAAALPSPRSGHSEQLHPSVFMWFKEYFTQRFSTRHSEEHAGTEWTRTAARDPQGDQPLLLKHWHNTHWPSPSNPGHCHVCCVRGVMTEGCVQCLQCDVSLHVNKMCFVDYHTRHNCKTSPSATLVHKVEPVTKTEAQKVDFYKFLATNFVYLGNKTINSILKDILYHLRFISNKLMFNAETQRFSFKDYSCFCEGCVIKQIPPEKTT